MNHLSYYKILLRQFDCIAVLFLLVPFTKICLSFNFDASNYLVNLIISSKDLIDISQFDFAKYTVSKILLLKTQLIEKPDQYKTHNS